MMVSEQKEIEIDTLLVNADALALEGDDTFTGDEFDIEWSDDDLEEDDDDQEFFGIEFGGTSGGRGLSSFMSPFIVEIKLRSKQISPRRTIVGEPSWGSS
jgi:hypothetical protein